MTISALIIVILEFFVSKDKKYPDFYCQRDIEDKDPCKEQCDHCKEYYKALENEIKN